MDDYERLTTAALFFEQIASEYPAERIPVFDGVLCVPRPARTCWERWRLRRLWWKQGCPRRRGVIVQVGTAVLVDGGWQVNGWTIDGRFCAPQVPALAFERLNGVLLLRAFCGWHLLDLAHVAVLGREAGQLRLRGVW